MNTKRTLFVIGGLAAMVMSAALATALDLEPLVVTRLGGTLHLQQDVPCNQVLDVMTEVKDGQIEMTTPARGIDTRDSVAFNLTRLTVSFKPFRVDGQCRGIRDSHKVQDIVVRLVSAVFFNAVLARDTAGNIVYHFRIPKEDFLLYESFGDNGVPRAAYKPAEEVTGVIDLARGTLQLHIVMTTELQFRAGCRSIGPCIIDEKGSGRHTSDIFGRIVLPKALLTAPR